jgi:uncharacterized peroxidase-related enzyme
MTFIQTVPDVNAKGETADLYARNRDDTGQVPNFVKAFSHRPDVLAGFDRLLDCIKSHMDPRRYELVTIAAAKELNSSYCMLAHGSVLLRDHYDVEQLTAIARNPGGSDLDRADKAVMVFATKVVRDPMSITQFDIDDLKAQGLSDAEIFDVVSAASARCFISKTVDALGALPDAKFASLDADLQQVLVVGRPISE